MDWKRYFTRSVLMRGEGYYRQNRVTEFKSSGDRCTAFVEGQDLYRVSIEQPGTDRMFMYCNCPHAREGYNCKHMAAVLYKWEAAQRQRIRLRNLVREPLTPAQQGKEPFYHMADIIRDYSVMRDDLLQAREYIKKGQVRLDEFSRMYYSGSYYDSVRKPKSRVLGSFISDGYSYDLEIIFDTDSIEKYRCEACGKHHYRSSYYNEYRQNEYEFCPHIMALILLADEYTKQYDPGDYTDLTALRFMRSFDRERVKTIAAEMSEDEGNVVLEPRIVEGLAGHELNFRIGNGGKLFVVKNLTDLHDIVNERKQFPWERAG